MSDEIFDPEIHASNADGSPKLTKSGRLAKKRGPRPGVAAPRRRGVGSASVKKGSVDYRPGINGLFQLVAVPLSFKAPADAWAVGAHGPNIAEALNELAKERPEVAAVLEKVLSVGPYGLVLSATLPLVVQLLHNHNVIPVQVAGPMGAVPRDVIMSELRAQAEQAPDGEYASAA